MNKVDISVLYMYQDHDLPAWAAKERVADPQLSMGATHPILVTVYRKNGS